MQLDEEVDKSCASAGGDGPGTSPDQGHGDSGAGHGGEGEADEGRKEK